ncbi:MAG: YkgJ family cysteine cluster protein [Methanocalculus sp. MSAO_Arc1]|nr:MAG: YkgJ family cysteine cluster protein [Methanocalculus sp. MSAO_Arc1]
MEKDYGEQRYLIRNCYTGERTAVQISPGLLHRFLDDETSGERPEACPFFRFDPDERKGYCCVHLTRPAICRDYGCWRILISNADGERLGRIMGSRHLSTEDPKLLALFRDETAALSPLPDSDWDDAVILILRRAGYTVSV